MTNSIEKGKAGERELSQLLRDHGFTEARRGRQYKGTSESPDVVGIPGVHIECKRVHKLGYLYGWVEQAERESAVDEDPVVFAREDGKACGTRSIAPRWLVIMDAKDYLDLMAELIERREHAYDQQAQAPDPGDADGHREQVHQAGPATDSHL